MCGAREICVFPNGRTTTEVGYVADPPLVSIDGGAVDEPGRPTGVRHLPVSLGFLRSLDRAAVNKVPGRCKHQLGSSQVEAQQGQVVIKVGSESA
jgi:hypothetical protein